MYQMKQVYILVTNNILVQLKRGKPVVWPICWYSTYCAWLAASVTPLVASVTP
jgi:hypothetical protein